MDSSKINSQSHSTPQQHKRPRVTLESISRTPLYTTTTTSSSSSISHGNDNDDEIRRLKAMTLKLEHAYKNAQARNEAIHIEHKAKYSEYDFIIERLTTEKKDAEARAIYHHKRSKDAAHALELVKMDHTNVTERLRTKLEELEAQNARLSTDIFSEQRERQKATWALNTKESEWTNRIQQLETTVDVLKQQVEKQQESIALGLEREYELNNKWKEADNKLKELNNAKFDTEAILTFDRQVKLQDDTRKIEMENYKLKNELKHYKEMYHNVEMLREEKYSLEARVRNMEQLSTENVRLDLENTRLKMEKLEWAGYLEKEDGLDIETPQGLVYNLTKERNESRWIVNQIDVFKKEMENRDQLILKLETHMNELKKTIQDKDRLHRSDVFAMELLEKDKIMLRKHIEALENQFKLYDIEESNYMEGNYDIQKTQRIQQLEELLKDFEGRLSDQGKDIIKSQMEASYSSPGTISPGPYFELASGQSLFEFMSNLSQKKLEYMEDTKTLQSNLNNANSQINILRNQLSLLQDYFGRHGMDPSSTVSKENNITQANNATDTSSDHVRILALKENPASVEYGIRKRQLENLRQENKILLEQLLHYQTSTIDSSMDLSDDRQDQETIMISIPKKTLQNMEDQKQALEQEVAKREKRIARKDEAYQRQLDQLADIMPGVLGYRLKPTYDGKMVLLESSYVNSKDLSFQVMFLKNGQSTVKVLGRNKQEYLRTLQSAYDTFITERKSIPGFLSAVTLDLQDRQAHIQPDMYDPTVTRDYDSHSYSEEDPLTDVHGHELVEPAAIDREDELDTDFVAQADDSGDNDYIECIPDDDEENNNDGYDEDRLKYFEGEDEEDTEDYEPKYENREIHNQERSQEATYEEYSNNDDDDDNGNDDDDDDLIDNEIKQHEHDQTEVMDEEDELGYGENDGDEDEEDEVGGNEDEDESMEESDEQQQQGQENDPISLDDDSD